MSFATDLDVGQRKDSHEICEVGGGDDVVRIGMDTTCETHRRRGDDDAQNLQVDNVEADRARNGIVVLNRLEQTPEIAALDSVKDEERRGEKCDSERGVIGIDRHRREHPDETGVAADCVGLSIDQADDFRDRE